MGIVLSLGQLQGRFAVAPEDERWHRQQNRRTVRAFQSVEKDRRKAFKDVRAGRLSEEVVHDRAAARRAELGLRHLEAVAARYEGRADARAGVTSLQRTIGHLTDALEWDATEAQVRPVVKELAEQRDTAGLAADTARKTGQDTAVAIYTAMGERAGDLHAGLSRADRVSNAYREAASATYAQVISPGLEPETLPWWAKPELTGPPVSSWQREGDAAKAALDWTNRASGASRVVRGGETVPGAVPSGAPTRTATQSTPRSRGIPPAVLGTALQGVPPAASPPRQLTTGGAPATTRPARPQIDRGPQAAENHEAPGRQRSPGSDKL
ncbi:MAG: hypothetical protein HOV66_25790 [Streptomycetaceae bacterium]|nr:hypothetical protein [Streptomycetaceae bacterium]